MPRSAATAAASVDLPLAGGPQTTSGAGPRARQPESQRERQALLCALRRRVVALPGAHDVDLGPHERPVAGHGGEQGVVAGVAAGGPVGGDEGRPEVRRPSALEVHDEEAEVGGDVRDAQGRVELERVDDLRRVGQHHVLGAQVAVAVGDEAARAALEQLLAARRQHGLQASAQARDACGVRCAGRRRLEVVERRPHRGAQGGQRRDGRRGGLRLTGVEPRQEGPHGARVLRPGGARRDPALERLRPRGSGA